MINIWKLFYLAIWTCPTSKTFSNILPSLAWSKTDPPFSDDLYRKIIHNSPDRNVLYLFGR